jgi:hypothetical protein
MESKTKIQCNANVSFHQNPFLAPLVNFSSSSKAIQCPNDHQLRTFPISPSWFLAMNMNSNFQVVTITQPYTTTLLYNDTSFCPFYPIMTIQLCPLVYPMMIEQFYL